MIKHTLDKTFGEVGTNAGYVFMAVGIYLLIQVLWGGVLLFILGVFVAFTTSSTYIDFERRRVKHANAFFGFIPQGKWHNISNEMKIGIQNVRRAQRAYSRSNRALDIRTSDFRIILYTKEKRALLPLEKFKTKEDASKKLEIYADKLQIEQV